MNRPLSTSRDESSRRSVAAAETLAAAGAVSWLLATAWARAATGCSFVESSVMIQVPVSWLVLSGRRLQDFGMLFRGLRSQLRLGYLCPAPYGAAQAVLAMATCGEWRPAVSILLAAVVLVVMSFLLRSGNGIPCAALLVWVLIPVQAGRAASAFSPGFVNERAALRLRQWCTACRKGSRGPSWVVAPPRR